MNQQSRVTQDLKLLRICRGHGISPSSIACRIKSALISALPGTKGAIFMAARFKLNLRGMKTTTIIALVTGITTMAALTSMSGPVVTVRVPAPVVTVQVPAPAVTVAVPDTYVWDGYEYVGVVGDQYYYLGPGDVWLTLDAPRLVRFHTWEKAHADWRTHAIRNERYRKDAHGHVAPPRDNTDHSQDKNKDNDKDKNHGH
jgi:hypothetical protein